MSEDKQENQKLMQKLGKIESKKREDYLRKLFYLMRLRPNIAKMLKQKLPVDAIVSVTELKKKYC